MGGGGGGGGVGCQWDEVCDSHFLAGLDAHSWTTTLSARAASTQQLSLLLKCRTFSMILHFILCLYFETCGKLRHAGGTHKCHHTATPLEPSLRRALPSASFISLLNDSTVAAFLSNIHVQFYSLHSYRPLPPLSLLSSKRRPLVNAIKKVHLNTFSQVVLFEIPLDRIVHLF